MGLFFGPTYSPHLALNEDRATAQVRNVLNLMARPNLVYSNK